MGTRSTFPSSVHLLTSAAVLSLPTHLSQPAPPLHRPSIFCFHPHPRSSCCRLAPFTLFQISLNTPATPLTDLKAFLLLFLAPSSFHPLICFLLSQLNCHPANTSSICMFAAFPSVSIMFLFCCYHSLPASAIPHFYTLLAHAHASNLAHM